MGHDYECGLLPLMQIKEHVCPNGYSSFCSELGQEGSISIEYGGTNDGGGGGGGTFVVKKSGSGVSDAQTADILVIAGGGGGKTGSYSDNVNEGTVNLTVTGYKGSIISNFMHK